MDDIQNLFDETIAKLMENGLKVDLDDKFLHRKYGYKNKDTGNNLSCHRGKTLRTSFGDVAVSLS